MQATDILFRPERVTRSVMPDAPATPELLHRGQDVRFPTLQGDTVVFTDQSQLYRAGSAEPISRGVVGWNGCASLAADGRTVAFQSDTRAWLGVERPLPRAIHYRIYVDDGTTLSCVSGADTNGSCERPSISADGTHVAFESNATNLAEVSGKKDRVYVVNRTTGDIRLVSSNDMAAGGASVSADGRYVAFVSKPPWDAQADMYVPNRDIYRQVWVHDCQTGRTRIITKEGNDDSSYPSISDNGQYVAFWTNARNLAPGAQRSQLLVVDTVSNQVQVVRDSEHSHTESSVSMSGDGRFIAFNDGDAYVTDRLTGRTSCVNVDENGQRIPGVGVVEIARDGERLVFLQDDVLYRVANPMLHQTVETHPPAAELERQADAVFIDGVRVPVRSFMTIL